MDLGRPLVAIAALGRNRAIGKDNRLPWRIPEDFAFFKSTSRSGFAAPGVTVVDGWEALRGIDPGSTLFLAGGAQLYAEALPACAELLLTHVDLAPEADAFFPDWTKGFDSGELIRQGSGFAIRRHLPLRRAP
jgi:dihydrofolate reductase